MRWMVMAGNSIPSLCNSVCSLRAPQSGRCCRSSSTRCSMSAAVRVGLQCGRRLFSTTPAMPPASNLRNHVYPVGREILNPSHNSRRLFSPRLACTTKRILCSSTSTIPHAIRPSCKGSFPLPSLSQSVKDVLITICKGCHETAHRSACATLFGEVEGHQDFVGVFAVVLQGVFFEAVLAEAEGLVEAYGGLVVADHRELDLFDFLAGGFDYGLDELAAGAGASVGGADV